LGTLDLKYYFCFMNKPSRKTESNHFFIKKIMCAESVKKFYQYLLSLHLRCGVGATRRHIMSALEKI